MDGFWRHYTAGTNVMVLPVVIIQLANADFFASAWLLDELTVTEINAYMIAAVPPLLMRKKTRSPISSSLRLIGAASRR